MSLFRVNRSRHFALQSAASAGLAALACGLLVGSAVCSCSIQLPNIGNLADTFSIDASAWTSGCTTSCDDGIACTTDICIAGTCQHAPGSCPGGTTCSLKLGCVDAPGCTSNQDCYATWGKDDSCKTNIRCQSAVCVYDPPDRDNDGQADARCLGKDCDDTNPNVLSCNGSSCVDIQSDPNNCGQCGNSCGTGSWHCASGVCQSESEAIGAGTGGTMALGKAEEKQELGMGGSNQFVGSSESQDAGVTAMGTGGRQGSGGAGGQLLPGLGSGGSDPHSTSTGRGGSYPVSTGKGGSYPVSTGRGGAYDWGGSGGSSSPLGALGLIGDTYEYGPYSGYVQTGQDSLGSHIWLKSKPNFCAFGTVAEITTNNIGSTNDSAGWVMLLWNLSNGHTVDVSSKSTISIGMAGDRVPADMYAGVVTPDLDGYYESVSLYNGRGSVSLENLRDSRGISFDPKTMRPGAIFIEIYSSTNSSTSFDFCMTGLSLD